MARVGRIYLVLEYLNQIICFLLVEISNIVLKKELAIFSIEACDENINFIFDKKFDVTIRNYWNIRGLVPCK